MDRYQVVAPYVTVPTMTQQGLQIIGLGKGAFVPEDAPREWVERHLRKKLIEKVATVQPSAPAKNSGQDDETPPTPPESGPGSGKQAWADYAVARGMDREKADAMTRDELIAELQKG